MHLESSQLHLTRNSGPLWCPSRSDSNWNTNAARTGIQKGLEETDRQCGRMAIGILTKRAGLVKRRSRNYSNTNLGSNYLSWVKSNTPLVLICFWWPTLYLAIMGPTYHRTRLKVNLHRQQIKPSHTLLVMEWGSAGLFAVTISNAPWLHTY